MAMKVLVVGAGAREHALVKVALASPLVESVIAAPGNGGIAEEVPCSPLDLSDVDAAVKWAQEHAIDFVIVGPELPLSLGLVDALEAVGILAYGPNKKAAQLEASKAFTKRFLQKYKIPTAQGATFTDIAQALEYIKDHPLPVVIKASGLAAGKGVIIAQTREEAEGTIRKMMEDHVFGASGDTVLIECFLEGSEVSITAIVSGKDYLLLPPSQDHKRVGEGDTGPNTGGMGAYAPADLVTAELNALIEQAIVQPTLQGLIEEGIDFRGTLYIGLMITPEGPMVLEFNVRFGDPETQVLFPLIDTDPIAIFHDCAKGVLKKESLRLKEQYALCVVLASKGYPNAYEKGHTIAFPEHFSEDTILFHAGTRQAESGEIVTSGGRVLTVTALGDTLQTAADKAYSLCSDIYFKGAYYRRDIGIKQLSNAV